MENRLCGGLASERLDGDTTDAKPVVLIVVAVLRADIATTELQTVSVVTIERRSRPVITVRATGQSSVDVAVGRIEV